MSWLVPSYETNKPTPLCISIHTSICPAVSLLLEALLLAEQLFMCNSTFFFAPAAQLQHHKQPVESILFIEVGFSLKINCTLLPEHITSLQQQLNYVFSNK